MKKARKNSWQLEEEVGGKNGKQGMIVRKTEVVTTEELAVKEILTIKPVDERINITKDKVVEKGKGVSEEQGNQ